VEIPQPEGIQDAVLQGKKEVGVEEVTPSPGNTSEYVDSSLMTARPEFDSDPLCVGLAESSI
jgi:hypothetical protein